MAVFDQDTGSSVLHYIMWLWKLSTDMQGANAHPQPNSKSRQVYT